MTPRDVLATTMVMAAESLMVVDTCRSLFIALACALIYDVRSLPKYDEESSDSNVVDAQREGEESFVRRLRSHTL
jgi:hypothetical protein